MTFQPGDTVKNVSLVVYGDRTREADETVRLTLGSATGAIPARDGTVTILNND